MTDLLIKSPEGQVIQGFAGEPSVGIDLLKLMLMGLATKHDVEVVVDKYRDDLQAGRLGNPLDVYVSIKNCEGFFKKLADAFKPEALEEAKHRDSLGVKSVMGMKVSLRQPEAVRHYDDVRWLDLEAQKAKAEADVEMAKMDLDNIKEDMKAMSRILDKEGIPFTQEEDKDPIITVKY